MPKIILTGVPGLDGEYDLDMAFTHRDFHTIKQVAGVRASEVQDALEAGDLDIMVALAEIALRRAGVPHAVDQLWDADATAASITLDVADMEESEPDSPPEPEDEPRIDAERPPSGADTNGSTESSPETFPLLDSGTPRQVSSSARLTSTT